MSQAERLSLLERLGHVPDDPDLSDWQLAEKTSWWGKPLDPTEFWKGRIVWLDKSTRIAANKKGRGYPPIPYQVSLPSFSAEDRIYWNATEVDGPNLHLAGSDQEGRFWDGFAKTHPRPPEQIEFRQTQVAEDVLLSKHRFQQGSSLNMLKANQIRRMEEYETRRAVEMGYPEEAFSEDALFWSYVFDKRRELQKYIAMGDTVESMRVQQMLRSLTVDEKYVLDSLSSGDLNAANTWKRAYLQRLRKQRVDESYVNGYLKAWDLTPKDVFRDNSQP
jgi:hypothetical protein